MRIRAMIAEDERLMREELAYLLQQEDDVVLCPSAETGEQLLHLYELHNPHVIFLDIQMPRLSGVEVAKRFRHAGVRTATFPLYVFSTAYDQYAVEAFELEAIDYLLKPYDEERFKIAMERVRRRYYQLRSTEKGAAGDGNVRTLSLTDKLLVHDGERMVVLPPQSIYYIVRVERLLEIHTEKEVVKSKMTFQQLEEKLQRFPFFRCHRGYLVNLDYVQEITPWFNGAYNLVLQDGKKTEIPVSRAAGKRLLRLFEQ